MRLLSVAGTVMKNFPIATTVAGTFAPDGADGLQESSGIFSTLRPGIAMGLFARLGAW